MEAKGLLTLYEAFFGIFHNRYNPLLDMVFKYLDMVQNLLYKEIWIPRHLFFPLITNIKE